MDNKTQISIDYAGSGLLEALNIFSVLVGNRNCIIVLDEPALHLHPVKQCKLVKLLNMISETDNNQFIIITHSPYMVETSSLDDVVRFNLEDSTTKVYPLTDIFNQVDRETIKKEFACNPHYKNILFAKGIVIVEGESEEIGVPFLLQKAGFSLEEYDIEVFNAHSDTHFGIPAKIAEILNIPYVVICDSKVRSKIPNELESKVFMFEQDDFIEFLKYEFSRACERINGLNTINSKPRQAMMILQELTNKEISDSKKIKELCNFIKNTLELSLDLGK